MIQTKLSQKINQNWIAMNINDFFEMGPIGSEMELSPVVLAFPPFERILVAIKDNEVAIKEIKYILWLNTWNSPYNVVPPEVREKTIKEHIFNDPNYEIHDVSKLAEQEYVEIFQTTEVLEMLKSARIGIWYTNNAYKTLATDNTMDPGKVLEWNKKLGDSYKTLEILEKAATKQSDLGSKVRGGNEVGLYEMPQAGVNVGH